MSRLSVIAVLVCAVSPSVLADDKYIDDQATKATLEREAQRLHAAGETVPYKELREQLDERRHYDAPPPARGELTIDAEGLYDAVDDGVLIVARLYDCGRCNKVHTGPASGFVISEDGLAITNHHVMEQDVEKTLGFVAMTRDGRVVPVVEVLASSESDDVALIRLKGDGFTPVPIARGATVGDRVHAVTHPSQRFFHYSSGEIARFFMSRRPNREKAPRMTVTADYAKGSSGGPVFNDRGQVVGIVSTTSSIYADRREQKNLQMVFRDTIPYSSILALFDEDEPEVVQAEPDEESAE